MRNPGTPLYVRGGVEKGSHMFGKIAALAAVAAGIFAKPAVNLQATSNHGHKPKTRSKYRKGTAAEARDRDGFGGTSGAKLRGLAKRGRIGIAQVQ